LPDKKLEMQFDQAMRDIYRRALKECGYRATRFNHLVGELGRLGAAKRLLAHEAHQSGLATLWEHGRLDLSVEKLVLDEAWVSLFTASELATARSKLTKLGYIS